MAEPEEISSDFGRCRMPSFFILADHGSGGTTTTSGSGVAGAE